jgi:hypothetical protein
MWICRKIQLHEPLKTLGDFDVPIKLHKDVTVHLKVVIEKKLAVRTSKDCVEAGLAPLLSFVSISLPVS